jgi:CRISPR-associated protein Cmr2
MSSGTIYTAITFAPVQGFIEKSRKLRDLYGSSYLLSFLSRVICIAAEHYSSEGQSCKVISPAMPSIIQGLPNVILIQGHLPEAIARECFNQAWACIVETCRDWIQNKVQGNWTYCWSRTWKAWQNYTWEIFYASTLDIDQTSLLKADANPLQAVRRKLNEVKRARAWTGINWTGESSSLTGSDAVAYPELEVAYNPDYTRAEHDQKLKDFYTEFRVKLGQGFMGANQNLPPETYREKCIEHGNVFLDEREQLSIPELIKRLITHKAIVENLQQTLPKAFSKLLSQESFSSNSSTIETELTDLIKELKKNIDTDLNPESFKDLNRLPQRQGSTQTVGWSGWFMGDGDNAGNLLRTCTPEDTTKFSKLMRSWGTELKKNEACYLNNTGRIIYAGGDDFLGVIYDPSPDEAIQKCLPHNCLDWFIQFKPNIWEGLSDSSHQPIKPPITPSVGLVWVSPKVPQRDLLQHCREAEKSAKKSGKDRIAIRLVFANGNTVEWTCPWRFLSIFHDYSDRESTPDRPSKNWTHFYNDVAVLESRHAFGNKNDVPINVAVGLLRVYFNPPKNLKDKDKILFYELFNLDSVPNFEDSNWWNCYDGTDIYDGDAEGVKRDSTGLLGDRKNYTIQNKPNGPIDTLKVNQFINQWVINLAKIGLQLCP